jgi:hypothetical protein
MKPVWTVFGDNNISEGDVTAQTSYMFSWLREFVPG